jgi:hypothetical protein
MAGTTSNRGYPFPGLTDDNNPPADIEALAEAVDADVEDLSQINVGAATPITANSSTWTGATGTETGALFTVTGNLIAGQKYEVYGKINVGSSVAGETSVMRIREDTASGNQVFGDVIYCPTTTANGFPLMLYVEYTAVSTAAKSFVLTGQGLTAASGAHGIKASAQRPCYFNIRRKRT